MTRASQTDLCATPTGSPGPRPPRSASITMLAFVSSSTAFTAPSKLSLSKVVESAVPVVAAAVLASNAMPAFAGDAGAGEQVSSRHLRLHHLGSKGCPHVSLGDTWRRDGPVHTRAREARVSRCVFFAGLATPARSCRCPKPALNPPPPRGWRRFSRATARRATPEART